MPAVVASAVEGHIARARDRQATKHLQPGMAGEIRPVRRLTQCEGTMHGRRFGGIVAVDLAHDAERAPRLGPACVERELGDDLHHLVAGHAVLLGQRDMGFQLWKQPLRHQRRACDHAAVVQRQRILAAPHLAKQYVIVEMREYRGEIAKIVAPCGLFDCHARHLAFLRIGLFRIPNRPGFRPVLSGRFSGISPVPGCPERFHIRDVIPQP